MRRLRARLLPGVWLRRAVRGPRRLPVRRAGAQAETCPGGKTQPRPPEGARRLPAPAPAGVLLSRTPRRPRHHPWSRIPISSLLCLELCFLQSLLLYFLLLSVLFPFLCLRFRLLDILCCSCFCSELGGITPDASWPSSILRVDLVALKSECLKTGEWGVIFFPLTLLAKTPLDVRVEKSNGTSRTDGEESCFWTPGPVTSCPAVDPMCTLCYLLLNSPWDSS